MRKMLLAKITPVLIAAALAVALVVPGAASDTTTSWNAHASSFNFNNYPQSASASFYSAYTGSDFASDFAGIKQALAADLMTIVPGWNGDDTLNVSLETYP